MEALWIVIGVIVVLVIPATVTGMKGKWGFFTAGIFLTAIFLWVGAIRLAKPESHYYERHYGHDKRKRSWERFNKTPYPSATAAPVAGWAPPQPERPVAA
jgi:hypothetical protein